MTSETDIVLSAIRRGEDSLPKLRSATGLDYAKLHTVLHKLEFEWRSIQRNETADGFDRYVPTPSERSNGFKGTHWKDAQPQPISPKAFHSTRAAADAREAAILQREAPYCVSCHGVCVLHGTDRNGRIRWRCKPCEVTFAGSGEQHPMNRLEPEKRQQAISAFNEGKSVRKVAAEVGIATGTALKIREEEKIEALCPCGQDAKHQGWCSHRYQNSPARQETVRKMNMGHIDPEMKILGSPVDAKCGCGYSANHRGRCADGQPKHSRVDDPSKSGENITETITKPDVAKTDEIIPQIIPEATALARNPVSVETPKEATRDAFCLRNCDPPTCGHHIDCKWWKTPEGVARMAELNKAELERPPDITSIQINMAGRFIDKNFKFPPSAILQKIVMDDDFFRSSYDTLINILDADMDKDEEQAVWTLIRYLKCVEKSHQEAAFIAEMEFRLPIEAENHTESHEGVIS